MRVIGGSNTDQAVWNGLFGLSRSTGIEDVLVHRMELGGGCGIILEQSGQKCITGLQFVRYWVGNK